jgi:hypothetical protein
MCAYWYLPIAEPGKSDDPDYDKLDELQKSIEEL